MESSPDSFFVINGGLELLGRIEPLWGQLRDHHADLAPRWKQSLLSKTFGHREMELRRKSEGGLLVSIAVCDGTDIGYCISTISNSGEGEVDSLFVVPSARNRKIGSALMAQAMRWFESRSVRVIAVEVIAGNEMAIEFYTRYGFSRRTVRLLKEG